MINYAFLLHLLQHVDSRSAETRIYWRSKYFDVTDEEAADPRPFEEVIATRKAAAE